MKTTLFRKSHVEAFSLRIAKALTTSPLDVLSKSTARPPVQTQMDLAEMARMRDEIAKTVGLGSSETLAVHRWIMDIFKETFRPDLESGEKE